MGSKPGLVAAILIALLPQTALGQRTAPMAVPIVESVSAPADTPWPGGTIGLDIDATDTQRGVFRVTQSIPVAPGTMRVTLLYPRWLPGNHAPRGPLAELADLRFSADGKPAAWRRDPVEVYAFHVELPAGTRVLTARYVHTSPLQPSEGRIVMTPEMLNLQWEKMSLYPAGHYVRRIRVRPSVTLPAGWNAAVALDGQTQSGNRFAWAETDYETLVDSPVFAGQHFRRWDLGSNIGLNVFADAPELLDARPEQIAAHRAMAEETLLAFGHRHFDRYEFLVALSNRMGSIGLEHLRSSENQFEPDLFTQWARNEHDRDLLPHELAHSWDGKLRRPARLWTPDYRQPMQGDLLWVYEGQTQFWGWVLAARSGLWSPAMALGQLASSAGGYAEMPGREWRSIADTTHDPIVAARKAKPFPSLARSEDYYSEGALIWLEADQIIRAGTAGRRGLDDFARLFFGARAPATYELDDVIAALDAIHPHDWKGFFASRIASPGQPAPLGGLERGGYRLVWKEEPNPFDRARMDNGRGLNLYHSLGLTLDKDGSVTSSRWGGPAFNAGIVNGARLIAVNSMAYDPEGLKRAITQAKGGGKPIELLVRRGDRFLTVAVSYNGGLRWPWLERTTRGAAPLDLLLAPRRTAQSQ